VAGAIIGLNPSENLILQINIDTNNKYARIQTTNDAEKTLQARIYGSAYAGTLYGLNVAGLAQIYSDSVSGLVIAQTGNYPIVFATNSTERMRIAGSGNTTIIGAAPSFALQATARTGFGLSQGGDGKGYLTLSDDAQLSILTNNITRITILGDGHGCFPCFATAMADADMLNNSISFYGSGTSPQLIFKLKDNGGVIHTYTLNPDL
jgi:hypothetical protein